jgi:hypothetical protein
VEVPLRDVGEAAFFLLCHREIDQKLLDRRSVGTFGAPNWPGKRIDVHFLN